MTLRFSPAQPRIKEPARVSAPGTIPEAPGSARGWECLGRWREKPRPDPIPKGAASPQPLWIRVPSQIQVLPNLSRWKEEGAGREDSHPWGLDAGIPNLTQDNLIPGSPSQPSFCSWARPPRSCLSQTLPHLRIPWNSPARDFPCTV